MADEKKPKIDLKARLGKTAVGATPPPGAVGMPVPTPPPGAAMPPGVIPQPMAPTPAPAPVGVPAPPGIPVGPPPGFMPATSAAVNPLMAAARPAAPPQPQRIEVDESAIEDARKGARRQGLLGGTVLAFVLGAIGFVAGGAQEMSKGRAQSVAHAGSLVKDVEASRAQLKTLADKLEAGRNSLAKDKKFPESLARDLSGIHVDFDGAKLEGVRFSGFSKDASTGLIEYISAVQATNDRKTALMGLLGKLQKPITEALAAQASDKAPAVSYVVLLNRDSAKNLYGVLAPLQKPVDPAQLPTEFTATNPLTRSNVSAPRFTAIDKPGAAYMDPRSISATFPSETTGQIVQLVGQLSRLLTDIRGEGGTAGEVISEPKPGLLERSDRLIENLSKIK
jgi:hypothetical protein